MEGTGREGGKDKECLLSGKEQERKSLQDGGGEKWQVRAGRHGRSEITVGPGVDDKSTVELISTLSSKRMGNRPSSQGLVNSAVGVGDSANSTNSAAHLQKASMNK